VGRDVPGSSGDKEDNAAMREIDRKDVSVLEWIDQSQQDKGKINNLIYG